MGRGFEIVSAFKGQGIIMPERKTACSAGYDICAAADVTVPPGEVALIPTGLKAYMQRDEYLGIFIRSSIAVKYRLALINGQGIVDADYYNNPENEGHIMLAVINLGTAPVSITRGMRIAQGIFYRYLTIPGDTAAGPRLGGYGSTGV